jgi:hypothetical protein
MPDNPPKDKAQDKDKGGPAFGQGVPNAPAAAPANPPQPGGNVVQTPGQTQPAAGQAPPVQQQQATKPTAQATGTATGTGSPAAPKADMTLAHTLAQTMALIQAQQSAPAVGRDDADETHEGGKYVVDGREVNAWGADFREGQSAHDDNPELTRFNRPR